MGKPKRPCLECRRLFLPTADKNSYCPDCFVKYNNLRNQQRRMKPKKKDTNKEPSGLENFMEKDKE